jgi:hypothetical protein
MANASDYYAVGLVPSQARTEGFYLLRIDQTQHHLAPTRAPAPNAPPSKKQLMVVRGGSQAGSVDKRRDAIVSSRATVEDVLEDSGHSHSAKLFLWNEKTGEQYELDTGEADSEVVLVTGGTVVYRVNDSLFEAGFRGGKVLPPTLLASGRPVTGVHWVFTTP